MELALLWHRGPGLVRQLHTFTNYVKVTFFPGHVRCDPFQLEARPRTRAGSTSARTILDEAQMARWIRQAGRPARLGQGVEG